VVLVVEGATLTPCHLIFLATFFSRGPSQGSQPQPHHISLVTRIESKFRSGDAVMFLFRLIHVKSSTVSLIL